MPQLHHWHCSDAQLLSLLRRLELAPALLRRFLEEEIKDLVALPESLLGEKLQAFRGQHQLIEDEAFQQWLRAKDWSVADLEADLARLEALHRFALDRFAPAVEDLFLQRKDQLDRVIYSLLRVQNPGLARELWIQISEGEISFNQAASQYGEGPEASHGGLMGPVPLGSLYPPELAQRLRRLRPGDVEAPQRLGDWSLLLRLEQIQPAVLDGPMRDQLIREQLDHWLQARTTSLLAGSSVEPLSYHPSHD
jgi:parvulin-like peptidyl-prolyl isomerase